MIEAMILQTTEVIDKIKMENLGKVNVICGKNSSGKTSILKSIENNHEPSIGFRLTIEDIKNLQTQWLLNSEASNIILNGTTYTVASVFNFFVSTSKVFENLKLNNDYFYAEDYRKIGVIFWSLAFQLRDQNLNQRGTEILDCLKDENILNQFIQLVAAALNNTLSKKFEHSTEISPLYISPKRKINTSSSINLPEKVGGDGSGLIEKVFHLKSSLSGSRERDFYEKLFKTFSEVTENFKFDIVMNTYNGVALELYFSPILNEKWVKAENAGLGLQDLFVIMYHALNNESNITQRIDNNLILVEEPENHLHPYMQRRLLSFLKEQTSKEKQFIISTHSNVFLDNSYVDRIFFSKFENNKIQLSDASTKSEMLADLGYSVLDNLVSDLIIMVEGSSDKIALTHFLQELNVIPQYRISIWVLSGDTMNSLDLSSFAESYKMIALLDQDIKSDRSNFKKECKRFGVEIVKLKRYSIENYIPLSIYRKSFTTISPKVTELEPSKTVWGQLGNIRKSELKKGVKKFFQQMSLDDLRETDLLTFLNRIKKIVESK